MKILRLFVFTALICLIGSCNNAGLENEDAQFNTTYTGDRLNRVAFPMGGMGAGMICLEGTGAISHVSVRHKPDVFNEPFMFGAIAVEGLENGSKVLEGPVPERKLYGAPYTGNGSSNSSYGFPRFDHAEFLARFPFATVKLQDDDIPLDVEIKGWSPFIPGKEDLSSMPMAALEYTFANRTDSVLKMVFSYHAENFMRIRGANEWGIFYENKGHSIKIRGLGAFLLYRRKLSPVILLPLVVHQNIHPSSMSPGTPKSLQISMKYLNSWNQITKNCEINLNCSARPSMPPTYLRKSLRRFPLTWEY